MSLRSFEYLAYAGGGGGERVAGSNIIAVPSLYMYPCPFMCWTYAHIFHECTGGLNQNKKCQASRLPRTPKTFDCSVRVKR